MLDHRKCRGRISTQVGREVTTFTGCGCAAKSHRGIRCLGRRGIRSFDRHLPAEVNWTLPAWLECLRDWPIVAFAHPLLELFSPAYSSAAAGPPCSSSSCWASESVRGPRMCSTHVLELCTLSRRLSWIHPASRHIMLMLDLRRWGCDQAFWARRIGNRQCQSFVQDERARFTQSPGSGCSLIQASPKTSRAAADC